MTPSLEQILADYRGDAQVLRRQGHPRDAELIERLCDQVATAAEDYLTFLPEDQAIIQSGRSRAWFRSRFAAWQSQGHARIEGGRKYRALIVPRRGHPELAYRAGQRAGAA